jgi:mitotic spindle assembly checkpoint protein MAD1
VAFSSCSSSLTQTFPSSPDAALPDAKTLQSRLSSLSALHTQATSDLAQKDSEIRNLDVRLVRQSEDSRAVIQDLTKKLLEAERECRWAKEGRAAAEKGEEFARKQVEALESSSVS